MLPGAEFPTPEVQKAGWLRSCKAMPALAGGNGVMGLWETERAMLPFSAPPLLPGTRPAM